MKGILSFQIFLIIAIVFLFLMNTRIALADTLYVGSGETYTTIQSAIGASRNGDTIIVKDGTYNGGVSVTKRLIFKSENGYLTTTAIGQFYINADHVTIDGFTIYGATSNTSAGIKLYNANNCTIVNNRCGISSSFYNWTGIIVDHTSNNNVISGNTCNYNYDRGIFISGSNNYIINNICNSNDWAGISVEVADNISIISNTCLNNDNCGIYVRESSSVIVSNNTCSNNQNGIYIISSNNNLFNLNKLSNNTSSNVFSPNSTNLWYSPVPLYYEYDGSFYRGYMGNYFSDHSLYDSNGDGIGDNNYDLPGTEPDAQYTLAAVTDNFNLHAWCLESDSKLYQFIGNQGIGKEALEGGSSHIWISDEPAKTALTFSGSNPWTGQLVFNLIPPSNSIMIEIGYSTNGTDFTTGGPQKLMGDGSNYILSFTTNSSSFTVPAGKYFAVRVTNYAGTSHDLHLGFGISFASPPGISCTNTSFYLDADGDGYGSSGDSVQACTHPEGYVSDDRDCDDSDALEHPNQTWYKDADGDGYSDGTTNTTSCIRPAGYKVASELMATSGDCDDNDSDEFPNQIWYQDADSDGYGNPNISIQSCTKPHGYVTNNTDCDDSDGQIYPGNGCVKDMPWLMLLLFDD